MKLLFVTVIIVLQRIEECVASAFCAETKESPVVQACADNSKKDFTTILLDTGGKPSYKNVKCRCMIAVHQSPTDVRLIANNGIELYNHMIQIKDLVLTRTRTIGSVIIHSYADLWVTPGGNGGVCVAISADNRIKVSCDASPAVPIYSPGTMRPATNTTTATTSQVSSQTKTDLIGNNKKYIIGAAVGGVSGFIFISTIILAVLIFHKRKGVKRSHYENVVHINSSSQEHVYDIAQFEQMTMDRQHTVSRNYYNIGRSGGSAVRENHTENGYYNLSLHATHI